MVNKREEQPLKRPPIDALEILGRWRVARLQGDWANADHAIAQLSELAERPRRPADPCQVRS
ncbi:MAG: hypothetical protein ACLQVD_08015 [Capsulimonadaceae bacterium]